MAAKIQKIKKISDIISRVCSAQRVQNVLEITLSLVVSEIIDSFLLCQKAAIGVTVEDQGSKAIGFEDLPMHSHIPNYKSLSKYF